MGRTKKKVYINLSKEIVEKARNHGLNISKVSENALKDTIKRLETPNPSNTTEGFSVNAFPKKILWWGRGY